MSDKLRELVKKWRAHSSAECARLDGDGLSEGEQGWHSGRCEQADDCADELEAVLALLPTEPVARDGWLLDGNLIYKLSEDRNPCNTHEVRVTQWSGSREKRDCDAAANALFCNSFNTTPTEPAPDREDAERRHAD